MIQAHIRELASPQTLTDLSYQRQVLAHWHDIRGNRKYPLRRFFRPQNFSQHISHFAVVGVEGHDLVFDVKLSGHALVDRLHLMVGTLPPKGVTGSDQATNIQQALTCAMQEAMRREGPLVASGTLGTPLPGETPDTFSVLVLPFSQTDAKDQPDTMIAAFDFTEYHWQSTPLH